MSNNTPVVQLESGSIHYALRSASGVKLSAMGKPVTATHLSGIVKISNGRVSTCWWTPGHTALVVAGAAASTAVGVGVTESTSGGPAVKVNEPSNGGTAGSTSGGPAVSPKSLGP